MVSGRTQRYPNNAVYRSQNLAAVEIFLHAELPDNIETIVKAIINAKDPEKRQTELDIVAKEFRDRCLKNVRAPPGEDDSMDPLYTAIEALRLKDICIHKKAAWRMELKPVIPQEPYFSSKFITSIHHPKVDGASAPLPKRVQ